MSLDNPPPRRASSERLRHGKIVLLVALILFGAQLLFRSFWDANPANPPATPLLPPSSYAPTPDHEAKLRRFVSDVLIFVMLHEMGHMIISEYHVPVLGREEDAADRFAAAVMTKNLVDGPDVRPHGLLSAAEFWDALHTRSQTGAPGQFDWADEHGQHEQRAYGLLCLLYGASPRRYSSVAQHAGIEPSRRESCIKEAAKNQIDWGGIIASNLNTATGAVFEIFSPIVGVIYRPIDGGLPESLRTTLSHERQVAQGIDILDVIAGQIKLLRTPLESHKMVAIPVLPNIELINNLHRHIQHPDLANSDLMKFIEYTVVGDSCLNNKKLPVANAFWQEKSRSITLCYGLVGMIEDIGKSIIATTP